MHNCAHSATTLYYCFCSLVVEMFVTRATSAVRLPFTLLSRYAAVHTMSVHNIRTSKVIGSNPLGQESRWIGLRAIQWIDPTGKERVWESADRKTRRGEIDGA
jgi:hypothetical protein